MRSGLALCALGIGITASAQDSFDDKPGRRSATPVPAPTPAPAPAPPARTTTPMPAPGPAAPRGTLPSPRPPAPAAATAGTAEGHDFGVQPVAQLRASNQLHGPTPTSIPGGRVVGTQQLAQWMQGQQGQFGRVMLLHAIHGPMHLPNAIPAAPASQGGSFDDAVQREFGTYLQQATGGDRGRLIVTYCQGVQCWGSYNAALRAIKLGYSNVHWYRGGIEAWQQAGLPVLNGSSR